MKKFKTRLSLTLQGCQNIGESLSELGEQMTIEENSTTIIVHIRDGGDAFPI